MTSPPPLNHQPPPPSAGYRDAEFGAIPPRTGRLSGMTRVEATVMGIDKLWDQLAPETQQWLVNNPGCRTLPRTVVAAINKATGTQLEQDRHGESILSTEDCEFIRTAAELQNAPRP